MTLSELIGSFTRRDAPPPRPTTTPASSPNALRMLEGELRFVPARDKEHSLGAQRDVRDRIADVLPGVTFDDDGCGAFTRTGYSVRFDTGCDDRVDAVRVQVTGSAAAIAPLQRLAAKTGWRLEPVR